LKPVVNYVASVELAYEENVKQAMKDYETAKANASANYDREIAIWEKQCAAERARYDKAMIEYNKKSGVTKLAEKEFLNEGKPVLNLPYKPELTQPEPPKTQKLFDKDVLAGSYLKLEGFNNLPTNAVKYVVTISGFEAFEPELKKTEYTETSKTANGQPTTYKVYKYYYSIQHKQAMSFRITLPDGTVLINQAYEKSNEFSTYNTSEYKSEYDLYNSFNKNTTLAMLEERITNANLKAINIFVNDKFGFAKRDRSITLYTVESSKKVDYSDFGAAYENVKEGLTALATDKDKAKMFLGNAAAQLDKILAESNPADKKARIDKKVTEAACKDAFEVNLMLNNFDACRKIIEKLKSLDPSKSDLKEIEELKVFLNDTEYRYKVNNN